MATEITFPDICEWYTPERIAAEEPLWANGPYRDNARRIEDVCQAHSLHTVIEVGCGTGWVPTALSPSITYVAGLDNNPHMLERAREKNPSHHFLQHDIRRLNYLGLRADLVVSFAVLKHFSLTEWPFILSQILKMGRFALFTQHILLDDRPPVDVGTEFHDIWPSRGDLMQAIWGAKHDVISIDYSVMDIPFGAPEAYVLTERRL